MMEQQSKQSQQQMRHDNTSNKDTKQETVQQSVSKVLVNYFCDIGVKCALGVSGLGISIFWDALQKSSIQTLHFRHESGAAFAATEAYFVTENPVVVFTTGGPGLTNALTGLYTARQEGAKVILVSGGTPLANYGHGAIQETSSYFMCQEGLFTQGQLFNYATIVQSIKQVPQILSRISKGMANNPQGFVVHVCIPSDIQGALMDQLQMPPITYLLPKIQEDDVVKCMELLKKGPFAIWVGFGARNASTEIRTLAEISGAGVMCTQRGKGIFPEDHPQFVGVTGAGGHDSIHQFMQQINPLITLILGTGIGQGKSWWSKNLVPPNGFIHVDVNPDVPCCAYPMEKTLIVQSDINLFVQCLIKYYPRGFDQKNGIISNGKRGQQLSVRKLFRRKLESPNLASQTIQQGEIFPQPQFFPPDYLSGPQDGKIRPSFLMKCIQHEIIDKGDTVIMADSGNSMIWTPHCLKFNNPKQYRVSYNFGSMGHFTAGVVGAAFASNSKVVAVVGDGAMLMNNEINTAVAYNIKAMWIVLNDGYYNMCEQGAKKMGQKNQNTQIPLVDFSTFAICQGAEGICIQKEQEIESSLKAAMKCSRPVLVDVRIDPAEIAPFGSKR